MVWSPVQGFITHVFSNANPHSEFSSSFCDYNTVKITVSDRKCNNLELSMNESMKGASLDPAVVAVARA